MPVPQQDKEPKITLSNDEAVTYLTVKNGISAQGASSPYGSSVDFDLTNIFRISSEIYHKDASESYISIQTPEYRGQIKIYKSEIANTVNAAIHAAFWRATDTGGKIIVDDDQHIPKSKEPEYLKKFSALETLLKKVVECAKGGFTADEGKELVAFANKIAPDKGKPKREIDQITVNGVTLYTYGDVAIPAIAGSAHKKEQTLHLDAVSKAFARIQTDHTLDHMTKQEQSQFSALTKEIKTALSDDNKITRTEAEQIDASAAKIAPAQGHKTKGNAKH